jgi:hypothetical protein
MMHKSLFIVRLTFQLGTSRAQDNLFVLCQCGFLNQRDEREMGDLSLTCVAIYFPILLSTSDCCSHDLVQNGGLIGSVTFAFGEDFASADGFASA